MRHRHKGRWLHARISEELEETLKREALRRRTPVSLLVRNVLEGAFDLVEELVEDSLQVAERSQRLARKFRDVSQAAAEPRDELADVYGWQELILARAAACARCDVDLAVGQRAFRGLREDPHGPLVFLCSACVGRLQETDPNTDGSSRGPRRGRRDGLGGEE